jgi:hypothetical protein
MRGAGYFTALTSDEVAQMLVDTMTKDAIYMWLLDLIQWEMPVWSFIAEHEDPDILIQKFADAFPDSVSADPEYE